MDTKLEKLLNLAFHPATGEQEATNAFLAARRSVGKEGMAAIAKPSQERVVYQDRVVYGDKAHTHEMELELKIPLSWLHTFMHNLFKKGRDINVRVDITRFATETDIHGRTLVGLHLHGEQAALKMFDNIVNDWIAQAKGKNHPSQKATEAAATPRKGFFRKLFGL